MRYILLCRWISWDCCCREPLQVWFLHVLCRSESAEIIGTVEARSELDEVDIEAVLREYLLDPSAPVPPASAVRYLALIAETHPESFDALFVELLVGHLPPLEQIETISTLVNKVWRPICMLFISVSNCSLQEAGIAREYVPSDRIDRLCLVAADRACRDEAFLVANELYAIAEPQVSAHPLPHVLRELKGSFCLASGTIRSDPDPTTGPSFVCHIVAHSAAGDVTSTARPWQT